MIFGSSFGQLGSSFGSFERNGLAVVVVELGMGLGRIVVVADG
jgi:hypothetical protein